ncbi:hypothetical protein GJ496_007629 [Pomphorhynchus laevis]|nr:hypothetical protein GJ496_007629 [Pomphorhynchus laevis]
MCTDGKLVKLIFLFRARTTFEGLLNKDIIILAIKDVQLDITATMKIDAISTDSQFQLINYIKKCEDYSFKLDESIKRLKLF